MAAIKIELLADVEGLGSAGSNPDVDDQTANDLVSAGKARQLNPFTITEAHTQAPPMSAEKVEGEVQRLRGAADDAEGAAKDVVEAQGQEGQAAATATAAQAGHPPKGTSPEVRDVTGRPVGSGAQTSAQTSERRAGTKAEGKSGKE
jgi:hypothetical protein